MFKIPIFLTGLEEKLSVRYVLEVIFRYDIILEYRYISVYRYIDPALEITLHNWIKNNMIKNLYVIEMHHHA